jgi:hypothetical protein
MGIVRKWKDNFCHWIELNIVGKIQYLGKKIYIYKILIGKASGPAKGLIRETGI